MKKINQGKYLTLKNLIPIANIYEQVQKKSN